MKKLLLMTVTLIGALMLSSCGPSAFTKGQYDTNVENTNLLNDQWSETDMQNAVKTMVESMVSSPAIAKAGHPPVLMVTNLQNKTSEHIDTQSIMDMVRVELTKTGKVAFVDKEARQDIQDEYNYQDSGMVHESTKKGPGGQVGADYIVNGRLDSIVQEVGKDKTIYYKLTLNMTNLKTSVITWTDQKQMRKIYRKQTIGL